MDESRYRRKNEEGAIINEDVNKRWTKCKYERSNK